MNDVPVSLIADAALPPNEPLPTLNNYFVVKEAHKNTCLTHQY
jgi:hypothetical protein